MAQLRQHLMLSNSDAYQDCVKWVGTAPASASQCFQASHFIWLKCVVCCWNLCQFCRKGLDDVCVQCGQTDCQKCDCTDPACIECHQLSYPKFNGWSGICVECRKAGKRIVPMSYAAMANATTATAAAAVVKTATKSPAKDGSCTSMIYRDLRNPNNNVRKLAKEELASFAKEYQERKEEGFLRRDQLVGYPKDDEDVRLRVVGVLEIDNPTVKACFDARHSLVMQKNAGRPEQYRFQGDGKRRVFHGTSSARVGGVVLNGFHTRYNEKSIYGKNAIYVSAYPYVPEKHAATNEQGNKYILACDAIIGNNVVTKDLDTRPLPVNADSGGDGTGHIFTLFNDADVLPRYVIVLSVKSE